MTEETSIQVLRKTPEVAQFYNKHIEDDWENSTKTFNPIDAVHGKATGGTLALQKNNAEHHKLQNESRIIVVVEISDTDIQLHGYYQKNNSIIESVILAKFQSGSDFLQSLQ